jgi:hypothetical protein
MNLERSKMQHNSGMKLNPAQIIELENETISLCQEMIRIPSVNHGDGSGD